MFRVTRKSEAVAPAASRREYQQAEAAYNEALADLRQCEETLRRQQVTAELLLLAPDQRKAPAAETAMSIAGEDMVADAAKRPEAFKLAREEAEARHEHLLRGHAEARTALETASHAEGLRLFQTFRPRHVKLMREAAEVIKLISQIAHEEAELVGELMQEIPKTGGFLISSSVQLPRYTAALGVGTLGQWNSKATQFMDLLKNAGYIR